MKRVLAAIANDDFTLELTFDDGSLRRFDAKPYLDKGIFSELRDLNYFRNFRISFGTVQWINEQDFAPETLYEQSELIEIKS